MKKLLIASVLGVGMLIAPAVANGFESKLFHSPSGNVGCVIFGGNSDEPQPFARCDVARHTWAAGPKPKKCDLDYGNGVEVGAHKKATYSCAGDTVLHQGKVLKRGKTLRQGVMKCTSHRRNTMRCVNTKSHHGFKVSRTLVKLF